MSSDYPDVLRLVGALATKVSESLPDLSAQAIGSALYGLQKLSSDKLEVRNLKKNYFCSNKKKKISVLTPCFPF